MVDATVVIGAGYGDEGKGRTVDFINSQRKCQNGKKVLGVRFNGGAQASHTVVRDGKRHAYSHFSSVAALFGDTYLDEQFILNPIVFRKEWIELLDKGLTPRKVYVSRWCKVTHIDDMLVGQTREKNVKHGSCGMGINATVMRTELMVSGGHLDDYEYDLEPYYRIFEIVKNPQKFVDKVREFYKLNEKDEFYDAYLSDLMFMICNIEVIDDPRVGFFNRYHHVIFEGAQGLQLSEDSNNFPHVTRSKTGLAYITYLLSYFDKVEVVYVSRMYQTKHGAGPFEYENDLSTWFNIVDETNVPNEWQGTLRFAPLDQAKLFRAIMKDVTSYPLKNASYYLALTCVDQIKDRLNFPIIQNGEMKFVCFGDFMKNLRITCKNLGFDDTPFYFTSESNFP